MKKIILFSSLFVFFMIGWTWTKVAWTNSLGPFEDVYTLIPMSGYTTLQIQYEYSTTRFQLKLPSKPDLIMEKIEKIKLSVSKSPHPYHIIIEFSSDYTTQFAKLTRKNIGKYMAVIADNKVLACRVITNTTSNTYIFINWSGTNEENSQFIKWLKGKPLEFYFIVIP